MRFLVIGLGSMGKRRIKCLHKLGHKNVIGYDTQFVKTLGVFNATDDITKINFNFIDAILICTPPDKHTKYIELAIEKKKPAFVEQSLLKQSLPKLNRKARKAGVFIAPSCTMLYHPQIQELDVLGITNFSYHVGQYLPDWHKENEFFGYQQETNACKEVIAFELSWITELLGFPKKICGLHGRTMNVGGTMDDTYAITMQFFSCFGTLLVDVTSRKKIRHLTVNTDEEQTVLDLDIPEQMYVDELKEFIGGNFPNNLNNVIKVTKLLEKIENG